MELRTKRFENYDPASSCSYGCSRKLTPLNKLLKDLEHDHILTPVIQEKYSLTEYPLNIFDTFVAKG